MEIKGKVHCFFEQSGTFKNEFIKLGIPAEDYDIQNNFGETDNIVDLFSEVDNAYIGEKSIFDQIQSCDLILVFFPCIRFCSVMEQMQHEDFYDASHRKSNIYGTKEYFVRKWQFLEKMSQERFELYRLALRLTAIIQIRGLRMIFENPWHPTNFTNHFWFLRVSFIDNDRTRRGDFYKKPTAYWFVNCQPTHGETFTPTPKHLIKKIMAGSTATRVKRKLKGKINNAIINELFVEKHSQSGICDTERSSISPMYARNFICDFILGKEQVNTQLTLFE